MREKRKILLIDDEQIMHDLAKAFLGKAGYQLLSAYSGKDGLKLLLEKRPDVILLDYMMADFDGEQVYTMLRRDPNYRDVRDTPVIFLSAKGSDEALKQRLMKKGIVAFLQKPFGLRELTDIIDNVVIVNNIRRRNQQLRHEATTTRKFLVQVIQNAPVGIFTANGAGDLTQANRHMRDIFKLYLQRPEDRINVFKDEGLNASFVAEGVKAVLDSGTEWRKNAIRVDLPDSDFCILSAHFVPMRVDGLEADGVIGIVEDLTHRERHSYEMQMLAEIAFALQETISREQIIHLILTGITAGQALSFTRAMVFLADYQRNSFRGAMAVGPKSKAEAHRIWEALAEETLSLPEFLQKYGRKLPAPDDHLNNLVRSLEIPFEHEEPCPLIAHILAKKTYRPDKADLRLCPQPLAKLGLKDFIAVPLCTSRRIIGMIIADNKYSKKPIRDRYTHLLTLLAGQAAIAIERANAYIELERKKVALENALQKLRDTQERLIHSERLAAIGEVAAHMAHEIRNPLVTIGGFARQLVEQNPGKGDQNAPANIIAGEVLRLESILANVLNFSKLPRPELKLNDVNSLVRAVCDQLRPELEQDGIVLRTKLQAKLPKVYFDENQIHQVLLNLLRNSQQSINGTGVISVETGVKGCDLEILVRDNGSGIPQESLDQIFHPFYSTKEHGTGLGLAISQQIVHEHGGEIEVYSEEGKGTVMRVMLPYDAAPQEADKTAGSLERMIL